MSKVWSAKVRSLNLLCQIDHDSDRPSFGEVLSALPGFTQTGQRDGAWKFFRMDFDGGEISVAVFVKRMILSVKPASKGAIDLSDLLNLALTSRDRLRSALSKILNAIGARHDSTRSYLMIDCDNVINSASRSRSSEMPEWVGDGMTTFALRAFDSRNNTAGIIRVSRHMTISYGLAPDLVADLNNLIFEKILYGGWPTSAKEVFELLDALGSYVLPTEVSLYTHRIASKLAAFAVVVGVLFSVVSFLQDKIVDGSGFYNSVPLLVALYVVFAFISGLAWVMIGRLSRWFLR
jgi:hypothetical protein